MLIVNCIIFFIKWLSNILKIIIFSITGSLHNTYSFNIYLFNYYCYPYTLITLTLWPIFLSHIVMYDDTLSYFRYLTRLHF